jgi:hypothetical protein
MGNLTGGCLCGAWLPAGAALALKMRPTTAPSATNHPICLALTLRNYFSARKCAEPGSYDAACPAG